MMRDAQRESRASAARRSLVLPLRISREHLDHEIVQAIVELLLQSPGKLRLLDFARTQQKNIGVHKRLRGKISNLDFDAFGRGPRLERKQRMFVSAEFRANFLSQIVHGRSLTT